ncbi:MAG: ribulose bisphosphate carboxylase small subunit [Gammaproteobacteria bacterium]|nr:ribulose bisphosphate carboxylase small subunit [Gammaproteobacteria bacterium]
MPMTTEMGDYQTVSTLETFGFLPPLTQEEIYDQVAYILAQGWTPAIEHVHPANAMRNYWTMWKLPFFGETALDHVVAELEACHRNYPDHHVRLIGYDNYTQSQGSAFVVFEGRR